MQDPKKSPSAYHRTTLSGNIFATEACIDSRKKLVKQRYCLHMSSQYGNFGPLTTEFGWRVWGTPANFNGFRVWLYYCSDVTQRRPTKLYTMFGRLLGWYTMYTFFGGFSPLAEFCQVQTSLCVKVLRSPILAALLHSTRPVGISQTLWHGMKNWITELSQGAPPVFGWVAIALGIGPHSSCCYIACFYCIIKHM